MERHEHYQKRTWRNKTAILGPERPLILTVPLKKGKDQQMDIYEVCIAYDENWPKSHLASIKSVYGKTAFYGEVTAGLELILMSAYTKLWDLNLESLKYLTGLIGGHWPINLSDQFQSSYPPDIVDLRAGVPGGVRGNPGDDFPVYAQIQRMQKTHLPNLSILDVLCHLGPETNAYLARYADKLYDKS